MLLLFQVVARKMTVDRLLDLRNEFVAAGKHPATVQAVDGELARRNSVRRLLSTLEAAQ